MNAYTALLILLIVGTLSSIDSPTLLASESKAVATVLLNCLFALSITNDDPVSVNLAATALIF